MVGNQRNSNLELYRIIGMLMMIAHHYTVNSGLFDVMYEDPLSSRSIFYFIFGAWGKTGINCFLMITGYYMCEKDIRAVKWLKLLSEMMFYRILFNMIFFITSYEPVSIKSVIKMLIPIIRIGGNFTGCFLLFYLFIPFLNILIRNLSNKQHMLLLILLGFEYVFLGTIPGFSVTMNYVSWFIVLYFIGAYIRLYPLKSENMPETVKKHIYFKTNENLWDKSAFWGWMSLISISLEIISIIACLWIGARFNLGRGTYYFVQDSNTLLALSTGIFTFLFFKNLKIPYNRTINIVAASTFGVLCIHANSDAMRRFLWRDLFKNEQMYGLGFPWWFIYPIAVVIGVFAVATVIDQIRMKTIEPLWMRFIEGTIERMKSDILKQG